MTWKVTFVTIRKALLDELDHLVSMMPVWQRYEKLKSIQYQTTQRPEALIEYMESHWRSVYMMEKVEFINKILSESDE